ncbi:hypothetical protein LQ772_04680 [Frateuria edaphi]|uniref:hypothetical protein n=1 Tax=Frateuria edaphi TaxID=2898793 RepID=UPI001E2F2292|nr:hypothetical protein [Frateuria edaphi]UGB46596.1 hypothetical protein LQ772_04680 [Frateuria edaphi]
MPENNLSSRIAASAVATAIASKPEVPVVVHWQLPDFPVHVAQALLKQGHSLVWVVASPERGDSAEVELVRAGIKVRRILGENEAAAKVTGVETKYEVGNLQPFEAPKVDKAADRQRREKLTPLGRARLQAKVRLAERALCAPDAGAVTIIAIGRLGHAKPVEEIASWASALVVFDHLSTVNVGWKDLAETGASFEERLVSRPHDRHAIQLFADRSVPQVFLTRDECAIALLDAYFHKRQCALKLLATKPYAPSSLRVSVVATDLVKSKHAAATFLGIRACSEVQVVGEAIFGSFTPAYLSMSTCRPLSRSVLKVSHMAPDILRLMTLQTGLSLRDYSKRRLRDHIRTTVMSFSASVRKPELVILCPWDLAGEVQQLTGCEPAKLSAWPFAASLMPTKVVPSGTKFVHQILGILIGLPGMLTDGRRQERIRQLMDVELEANEATVPGLLARLAHALHTQTQLGDRLDLADRPERYMGLSDRGDKALALFSLLLEHCLPWSPRSSGSEAQKVLAGRRRVFEKYRFYRSQAN